MVVDFVGFIVWAALFLYPPLFVREQAQQAGMDIDAFLTDKLPWKIKQLKSLFVRKLEPLSWLIALAFAGYFFTFFRLEPELKEDPIGIILVICSVVGIPLFARWNAWNGRLRYTPLKATKPAQQAAASRAKTQATATREVATVADQAFEARRKEWNPLTPIPAELVMAAMRAGQANLRMAQAYCAAAQAESTVHRVSSAMACRSLANAARDKLARIAATVPHAAIAGFFNGASFQASEASKAAELAMAEEDSRVFVRGFSTRASLPQVWVMYVMALLYASCLYVHIHALMVEDRWLVVLSFVPWFMAGALVGVMVEVLAWLGNYGIKGLEFAVTKVAWLKAMLPGDTLKSVQNLRVDLFNEEAYAKFLREGYWSLCFFAPLPYMAVIFWIPNIGIAAVVASASVMATITAVFFMKRGKQGVVEENTTKVVGFFYNYGKWITVVVLLILGSTVEWNSFMNRLVGITPVVVISGKPGWYVVFALVFLFVMWIAWQGAAKFKGVAETILKPVALFAGVVAVLCLVAPVVRAATERESLKLPELSGPEAEKPVQMTAPVVEFRPMANGHKEMVITFYTVARQATGVVRFDPKLASQLGVDQEVQVKSFRELVSCGQQRCRQHEVRIPELTTLPHGSFTVVMRHWLSVEVGEQTFI